MLVLGTAGPYPRLKIMVAIFQPMYLNVTGQRVIRRPLAVSQGIAPALHNQAGCAQSVQVFNAWALWFTHGMKRVTQTYPAIHRCLDRKSTRLNCSHVDISYA